MRITCAACLWACLLLNSVALADALRPPPDTLSLVVDAGNPQHLLEQLQHLSSLSRTHGVAAGDVLLVGFDWNLDGDRNAEHLDTAIRIRSDGELKKYLGDRTSSKKLLAALRSQENQATIDHPWRTAIQRLGLQEGGYVNAGRLLKTLNLTYSPAWIIRHRGRDYIFEGYANPEVFFNRQGEFRDGSPSDRSTQIARHEARASGQVFGKSRKDDHFLWGISYHRLKPLDPNGDNTGLVLSYDELPSCNKPDVVRAELAPSLGGSEVFDMLYYDPSDESQEKSAAAYQAPLTKYSAYLLADPETKQVDMWQQLARYARIDCLPTRFRVVRIGPKRFVEFRRGASAWTE